MPTSRQSLHERVIAAIDANSAGLIALSAAVHATPELSFQEHKSAALLCAALEKSGFSVERGLAGLDTAFRAVAAGRAQRPTIAFLAEYDALPEIGHACGHNIIGTAAVGAGIGALAVLPELAGQVQVIGTPAEEGGGGKIILVNRGVFSEVDAAMMVHPASYTMVSRHSLASYRLSIDFTGKASHAAAAPEDGINALEAVILTFNNVNAMRLHLKSDSRVHGIITHGGTAANIIPDHAAAVFSIRAASSAYALEVAKRVVSCAEGAALATGATLQHSITPGYAEMAPNMVMADRFADNWRSIGVTVNEPRPNERMGSTDFGNVSQTVPGIHPYISIAPDGTAGHTIEFREASLSPAGHEGMLRAAKAMAMTAIDLINEPDLLVRAKSEFAERSH